MMSMRLFTICLLWSSWIIGTADATGIRGRQLKKEDSEDKREDSKDSRQSEPVDSTTSGTSTGGTSFTFNTTTGTITAEASSNNNNDNDLNCSQELSFDIECQGDCNFAESQGTCESKMFQYHGGPCSQLSTISSISSLTSVIASRSGNAATNSDTAANCQDFNGGPPTEPGADVFVVIADAKDPSKRSQMWTKVGGFFWTDYRDYKINAGLSDTQNITFYTTGKTTPENMLQTMLFYAPCELGGTPLDQLDRDHASVQLFATAIDPKVRAHVQLEIRSRTQQNWQLQSASVTTNIGPKNENGQQGLPRQQAKVVLKGGDLINAGPFSSVVPTDVDSVNGVTVPVVVEMNKDEILTVESNVRVITPSGLQCRIQASYTSETRNAPADGDDDRDDRDTNTENTPPIPIVSPPSSLSSSSASKWWP